MKNLIKTTALALSLVGLATPTLAITCNGVEGRVNDDTTELVEDVRRHIESRTDELKTMEEEQRVELLSAIQVLTRQESLSAEQQVNADSVAGMALANTIIEQSVAEQLHDVVENYSTTGTGACDLVMAGANIHQMQQNYKATRASTAEEIRVSRTARTEPEFREKMAEWSKLVTEADDATVGAMMRGDTDAAKKFIAVVAGPPRWPNEGGSGSILSRMDRVVSLRDEARNSAATYVLSEIAAGQQFRAALDEKSAIWIGEDGGEEWSARMAASPTRATLLDTARIEAHNIAVTAFELRQSVLEEFSLATFALSHVDTLRERNQQAQVIQAGAEQ